MKALLSAVVTTFIFTACSKQDGNSSGNGSMRVVPGAVYLRALTVEQLETCSLEDPCSDSEDLCVYLDLRADPGIYCVDYENLSELLGCESGDLFLQASYPGRVACGIPQ